MNRAKDAMVNRTVEGDFQIKADSIHKTKAG